MDRLSTISSLSFDQYIELCIDTPFIEVLSTTLSISKYKVRTFMTAYVFKHFPSEIMSSLIRSPEDIDIIDKAKSLILSVGNSQTFRSHLTQYTKSFSEWKEFDKPRAAAPFINKYKSLRTIRDTNDYHYYKNELKLLIDMTYLQLIAMINSIGGETALERIDTDPEPEPDSSLISEFISSSKDTFWTTFREELPDYKRVIILLIDFAQRYRLLIPNRVDLLEQLGEVLDIEFIQQQLNTQTITFESLIKYMDYIVIKTKEVDMPSEDEITDRWFTDLKSSHLSVSDPIYLLQNFFEYILSKLDTIKEISVELAPTIRQIYQARQDTSIPE